ncbi:hypothetical protein G9A89_023867 [Geosiphon pyriformis]|nr:hypothetical protein G9A89_023867 [Geosiphon pyriformis]
MDQLGCRVDHAASACIIIANEVIKTPISKIDDFPFEINGIIIPIKVLVIKATQYQAFMSNDWLLKTHATFDWTTQELQLIFGVLWANQDHNELPLVPSWNDNVKGKQKETKLIWISDQAWETKNDYNKLADWKWKEEDNGKEKGKETILEETTSTSKRTSGWTSSYSVHEPLPQLPYIPLKCKDCEKKLSSIGAWIAPDEDHWT